MNTDKEKDYIHDIIKKVDGCLTFMIGCFISFISFALGILAGISYEKHNISTPVENTVKIDSLTTINDSIKIKIEKLDSIKDAKVIEVSTLDNDSTLKLFYKLVSE